jgi:HlyD family secretion protein
MKKRSLLLLLFLTACGKKTEDPWLGYGEGDNAFISAPEPGWVTSLKVQRGQIVHRGDLLFVLDNTHEQAGSDQAVAALVQAKANLTQQQSNLVYARTELRRQNGLARDKAGTPTQLDQALTNYQQSEAQISELEALIAQMEASLTSANYTLSQRAVVAQTDGPVQDIYFREGEYVSASTPVLSILPPANVYVRFFVPESQLSRVHLGQKVKISCDGCGAPVGANVSFIAQQEEFTPPVIFSADDREKLVFKLEARAPGGLKINPGQPVDVRPQ